MGKSVLTHIVDDHYANDPAMRFIIRFSLYKVPELLNVLKGDMGFIGPRPMRVIEWDILQDVGNHKSRKRMLEMRPGFIRSYGRREYKPAIMSLAEWFHRELADARRSSMYNSILNLRLVIWALLRWWIKSSSRYDWFERELVMFLQEPPLEVLP